MVGKRVTALLDERELTEKDMIEKTGHDRSFFKRARARGLKFIKYGRSTRYLWSDWLQYREQHRQRAG